MDEQERLADLRRRGIFTLLMLAGGSAMLAVQGEPEAQPGPRVADAARTAGTPAAPPRARRESLHPFNAAAARATPSAQPLTFQRWKRSTP